MILLDRQSPVPLARQIRQGLRAAILDRRLKGEQRLPSWAQLAADLGVARGTVQAAYEWLAGEGLVTTRGAAGTFVVPKAGAGCDAEAATGAETAALPLQLGLPALDAFPRALWGRIAGDAARRLSTGSMGAPDPAGWRPLRAEIAHYVGTARGLPCRAEQVFITGGHRAALMLITRALGQEGRCWVEDPGYPGTRDTLAAAGLAPVPVPVDAEGIDVAAGIARAPDALYAAVTPGHQAPLGMSLSPARRRALLAWAGTAKAWIVEDDYLGEFPVRGRPIPSLAASDASGRTLTIGSFSKTMMPALRTGYVVVPAPLADRFATVAAATAPATGLFSQIALARFMAEGHFARHLRRMHRLYGERRAGLADAVAAAFGDAVWLDPAATGLHLLLRFPDTIDDGALAARTRAAGLAPSALSGWSVEARHAPALILGFANVPANRAPAIARQLATSIIDS